MEQISRQNTSSAPAQEMAELRARLAALEAKNARLNEELAQRSDWENNLREAETLYRTVAHFAYDCIYWQTPKGALRYISPACERLTGYSPEALMANPGLFDELVLPEDRSLWDEHRHDALAQKREIQFRIRRRDGTICWIEHICQPVFDDDGTFAGCRVNNRDISRRKAAEKALQEHQEHLADLVSARTAELTRINQKLEQEIAERAVAEKRLQEQNFIINKSPVIVFLRQALEGWPVEYVSDNVHQLGYLPPDFYAGRVHFADIIHPDDLNRVVDEVAQRSRVGLSDFVQQYRIITHTGQVRWVEDRTWIRRDENDQITHYQGVLFDITARKETELALKEVNDELKQHLEELSTLNLIAQTIATMTDLEAILGTVAGTISRLFDACGTDISLLDGMDARLTVYARMNRNQMRVKRGRGLVPLVNDPAARRVIENRQSILIANPQTNPLTEPLHDLMRAQQINSFMNIPLLSRGEAIGLISVYTNRPHRVLTSADVSLAETIATQIAGAVETVRLLGEEQERRQEADRRRQVAESLGDILAVLNEDRPLEDTLDFIAGQANRLLSSDAAAIYQFEAADNTFVALAVQGIELEMGDHRQELLGCRTLREALATQQPLAESDMAAVCARDLEPLPPGSDSSRRLKKLAQQFQALLAIPLLIKQDVYGGILLYYGAPRTFSKEEIYLAVVFSSQVALAIENARLRHEAEKAAVDAERNRLARDLHDSVTQTLFSVAAIAEALPRVWHSRPETVEKALEELLRLTQGALAEMRNLLLELRPAVLVEKPMDELLHQLADAMMGRTRMQVTTTVVGEQSLPPDVKIAFYRIAQEALNNVTKHARAGHVKLGLYFEADQVELHISDNGRGFDPESIAPHQWGVNIMAERAEAIKADFDLESQADQGTQITVVWPNS